MLTGYPFFLGCSTFGFHAVNQTSFSRQAWFRPGFQVLRLQNLNGSLKFRNPPTAGARSFGWLVMVCYF